MAKLFRGRVPVTITKNGGFSPFGQPLRAPKIIERCAVVSLQTIAEQTSVRADTSASRGAAEELRSSGVLLFDARTQLVVNDMVEVAGQKFRVTGMHPQFDLNATEPDHFKVTVVTWIPT